MERPANHDKCITCNHLFGEHFLSFNEKLSGCGHQIVSKVVNPLDYDSSSCTCQGFTVVYKPETTPVDYTRLDKASAEDYYNK